MSALFSGPCIGKVINPEFGLDSSKRPRVRWTMEVTEGEHKGKTASYSGKLDESNIKYTKRDMIAIGWAGQDVQTFVADVKKAEKVLPFTAEVANYNGQQWTSAKMTGGAPLAKPDDDKIKDVNRWFEEAGDVTAPAQPSTGGARVDDSDLPF